MSDNADIAGEIIEQSLEANIRKATQQRPAAHCLYCEECGDEIPLKRREHLPWVTTCVECQQVIERQASLQRK